jgi:hypothetical protein
LLLDVGIRELHRHGDLPADDLRAGHGQGDIAPLAAGAPDGVGDGPRHRLGVDHRPLRYGSRWQRHLGAALHANAARNLVQAQEAHARRANIEP